jgi:GNAT superfamily N-acetyltransferase
MSVCVAPLTGDALKAALPDIARLRIEVFREWPYLYDGNDDYERAYFADFAANDGAVVITARDGDRFVGAATAAPMGAHVGELAAPLVENSYPVDRIFYLGESVLLKPYRGRGIGHAFFDRREAHARLLGKFTHAVFCAVHRPAGHPLAAPGYRPLDDFWRKRGYDRLPGLAGYLNWLDVGEAEETSKVMHYWMKAL